TYYAAEADLPENTFDAVNQLANKAELKALVDDALTAQGDYTLESYNEYTAKVTAAQAILDKVSATQAEVDAAKVAIDAAYETLQVRTPAEKTDANKSFSLLVNGNKELAVSDYVDDKELNNLTYEVSSADAKVTVSEIADGKFTVTAGSEEVTGATVSLVVKYKDREVLTVTITVNVTSETTPVLTQTAVSTDIDLYSVENKTDITLDFSSNVENLGELELTYTVTMNGTPITLDGTSYTYTYESYTETATEVVFAVTVSYTHNGNPGELNYNYTLNIKDTRAYRITNGGFENSLDGWTLSNSKLGGVNDDSTYWGNIPFNNDGNFFNAYAEGCREEAIGTLTSSPFTIGGSGWITYKLGGAKNSDKVFIEIVENGTGNILARYYNNAFSDDVESTTVRGCTLVAYKADLSAHIGETVYIRITDNAVSDYGLFFVDSFVTYYPEAPETGYTEAVAVEHPDTIYDIYNGGFESDLAGWTLSGGEIGVITDGDACFTHWAEPHTYGKEGDKLFSFWTWDAAANEGEGGEVNREGNMGTLTSSMFVLKKDKYISFKFGGGNNRNVFIELVNAENGLIVAVFHNDNCNGGRLISYNYKVDELSSDTLCYFRIVDNAVSDWGCFTADAFKTNLDSAPADSVNAVHHISEYRSMVNGSFETGNLDGWTMIGELGAVTDTEKAEGWYQTNESAKDGNNLFTFYYNNGTDYTNVEGNTGIIRSSAFILEKNGIISFRFGAAHNRDVYINVYTTGGKLLAQFRNNAWEQDTVMVQYYYQFDNTEEISCYFEVVDNATDDYGCIVMDDFCVNLEAIPEDAVLGSAQTKAERYPAD
ncbi:MAG: hypothetical protein HDR17_14590, partial [Lachnospiraceae bacterium]|nr:hypothetical protein [Lachnospiraceae bacterium]